MPSQLNDERVEFRCEAQVAGEGPDRRRNMPVRRREDVVWTGTKCGLIYMIPVCGA